MTTDRRHCEVSTLLEDPGPLSVMQVLSMSVEELRLKLQAHNLAASGTAKPDLQHALLCTIAFVPQVDPAQAIAASSTDAGLGAHPRTAFGHSDSRTELQLQL